MTSPADLRYSPDHTWVRLEGAAATVGITDYAQEQLGDVLYLQLPAAGEAVTAGEPFGVVQSFKSTSDLIAPVGGVVLAANDAARRAPRTVNRAPYAEGWLVRLRVDGAAPGADLLDGEGYDALVAARG